MALHILKNNNNPTWGNVLGSALGQGLSQLAEAKIAKMRENEDLRLLGSLGIDPLHARFINRLPSDQRTQAVSQYLNDQQQQETIQKEGQQPVSETLQSPDQFAPQAQESVQNLLGGQQEGQVAPNAFHNEVQDFLQGGQPQLARPQPQQAVAPAAPAIPKEGPHAKLGRALGSAASKGKTSDQELKERKQTFTEQQSLRPFLDAERKEYAVNRQIARKAQEALNLLREHHKDWPGAFRGSISPEAQKLLIRNPKVREYAAKINELVILKGQSRRGLPSNFKLKLEQAAKADLSQPLKTQEAILESMIEDAKDSEKRESFINAQKSQQGTFPLDLPQRAVDFDMAMDDPLSHPELFKDGTVIEDNGKQYTLKNGKWQ